MLILSLLQSLVQLVDQLLVRVQELQPFLPLVVTLELV